MNCTRIRTQLLALAVHLATAMLLVFICAPGANAAEADSVGFAVAPLKIDVDIKPGAIQTHQISISNTDDVAVTFTFSKEDFVGDKNEPAATPVLLGSKFDSAISGFDWITLPDAVSVPAGGTRTVNIKVAAPNGASGGHYAAVVVSGPVRTADGIAAQSRIGVLFLLNAGGVPPPQITITEVIETTDGGTKVVYTNDGKTDVTPKPTVTTKDPITKKTVKVVTGSCTTALPGGSGECTISERGGGGSSGTSNDGTTAGLPGTRYVELTDENTGARTGADLPTEWSGNWSSFLLPLVGIALFVLYFLFLRRRRKNGEDADQEGSDFDPWVAAPIS